MAQTCPAAVTLRESVLRDVDFVTVGCLGWPLVALDRCVDRQSWILEVALGAWGLGVFENDDALDVLGEIEDAAARLPLIRAALKAVGDSAGYLEAPAVSGAVAVAALVAGTLQPELLDSEPYRPVWWTVDWVVLSPQDMQLAAGALERAALPADNEWAELWDEAGEWDAVVDGLRPYRAALNP